MIDRKNWDPKARASFIRIAASEELMKLSVSEIIERFKDKYHETRKANIKETLRQMAENGATLEEMKSFALSELNDWISEAEEDMHYVGDNYGLGLVIANHADSENRKELAEKATTASDLISAF